MSTTKLASSIVFIIICPTLCNPKDGSPPGSPVPGILQARTQEWVATAFPAEHPVKPCVYHTYCEHTTLSELRPNLCGCDGHYCLDSSLRTKSVTRPGGPARSGPAQPPQCLLASRPFLTVLTWFPPTDKLGKEVLHPPGQLPPQSSCSAHLCFLSSKLSSQRGLPDCPRLPLFPLSCPLT